MKKILLIISLTCTITIGNLFAQSISTAYELADFQREGTARSVSMGNAMTALGGDLGAIAINPAASAVFKFNEFSFTPAITSTKTDTKYLGVGTKADKNSFGFANIGGVAVLKNGRNSTLRSLSFGFSYNKHNNFNSTIKAGANGVDDSYATLLAAIANNSPYSGRDFDDTATPDPYSLGSYYWPVINGWNASFLDTVGTAPNDVFFPNHSVTDNYTSDQFLSRKQTGSLGEYDINIGMNLNDQLYLGMNIGMFTVWNKIEEKYSEDNTTLYSDTDPHFSYIDQYYNVRTTGSGINLKLGVIWAPIYNIRLGASVATPTWYSLTDKYYWDTHVSYDDGWKTTVNSPEGVYDYRINTPFHYNLGFAGIWKSGSVSIDYEGSNIGQTKLRNRSDLHSLDYSDFSSENDWMAANFKMSNKLRVGVEVYPINTLALRAGFQYADTGIKKSVIGTAIKNYTGSVGLGYANSKGFYVDLAVAANLKKSNVAFIDTEPAGEYVLGNPNFASIERSSFKVLATFGWRF